MYIERYDIVELLTIYRNKNASYKFNVKSKLCNLSLEAHALEFSTKQ